MTDRQFDNASDPFGDEGSVGLPAFLSDPVRAIKRRWVWMAAALFIGLAATAAFIVQMKPRYLASATLLVSSQQIPEEFVRPTVQDDSLERMNAMVGNILSHTKLSDLIQKHGLYKGAREDLRMSELVAIVLNDVAIESIRGVTPRPRSESASRYAISFTYGDPLVAAAVANDLASSFTEANMEMRRQQARLTTDFLRRQLANAEADLREYERMIREFNEKYRGELPDELTSNLHKLEQLQLQRQSLAMQAAEGETRIAMLLAPGDANSPEARLAALRGDLAREVAVNTEEHPNVTSLRRQIAALEQQIRNASGDPTSVNASRAALVAAERRGLEEIRRQQQETEAQIGEVDIRVANTPKRQEELGALQEKTLVLRDNYREFLRKVQDAELAQNLELAQQGERVVVLDRAAPPTQPMRTRGKYAIAGIVASFGLSLGLGVLLELMDSVIVSADQIESTFGIPVLGSVYRIT
jgi:uncharacterized protein involved in exopolysaccharide biosynthesis